ncbi:IPT/TIG domain-containing protein [Natranaerobius trueperi]|uniref:Fibronectin type-III domain-containing protein n=1 Tax=Natranaerobius trueperi TaxID=759412 RepID=A0A226C0G5_9FIRM|nr:IPT/TIG domain-containing protein [Natranaerobius trueperi]OWZ84665.1 hypothetical protein CDO51_02575 [Natranaerobius trueperi]
MKKYLILTVILILVMTVSFSESSSVYADDKIEIKLQKNADSHLDTDGHEYILRIEGIEGSIRVYDSDDVEIDDTRPNDPFSRYKLSKEDINDSVIIYSEGERLAEIETDMPTINTMNPSPSEILAQDDDLKIDINNFDMLDQEKPEDNIDVDAEIRSNIDDYDIELYDFDTKGSNSFEINLKKDENDIDGFDNNSVDFKIESEYSNAFQIHDDLELEDVNITPNIGTTETFVRATSEDSLSGHSVFLQREDADIPEFSQDNRAEILDHGYDEDEEKYFLIFEVPNLETGNYYDVIITNEVGEEGDPSGEIFESIDLDENFLILEERHLGVIDRVEDDSGPHTGQDVTLQGNHLINLHPDDPFFDSGEPEVNIEDSTELVLNFEDFEDTYYRGKEVKKVKRVISGNINEEGFESKSTDRLRFNGAEYGTGNLDVRIPYYLVEEETTVNFRLDFETIITLEDDEGDKEEVELHEVVTKEDAYTIEPATFYPEIYEIYPDRIQVEETEEVGTYTPTEDELLFSVHGEDFFVTRFSDDEGNTVTRYPVIQLSTEDEEFILNPNTEDIEVDDGDNGDETDVNESTIEKIVNKSNTDLHFEVLNDDGEVVDGTDGNELGCKILVWIEDTEDIEYTISESAVGIAGDENHQDMTIYNPEEGTSFYPRSTTARDIINFIRDIDDDQEPSITNVEPDVITTEGGSEITIEGRHFQPGVRVFLDGEEMNNIELSGAGNEITFTAPPNRDGETQIQVMNPDGGIDTESFMYVETYTEPQITDISPKKGSQGDLVVMKGENFLSPVPMSGGEGRSSINYLLGTRVTFDGEDINDYNRDGRGNIELEPYKANEDLTKLLYQDENGRIQLADYYQSVVLQDNENNFYILESEQDGTISLHDGSGNSYEIEEHIESDDYLKKFNVSSAIHGEVRIALEESSSKDRVLILNDNDDYITELDVKTPYKTEDGEIIGDRVYVNHQGQISFNVSEEQPGYYDVGVENPDTSQYIVEDGFEYIYDPGANPVIHNIVPSEGSVDGGYDIVIEGEDFQYGTEVYIYGTKVPSENIDINPNETEINVDVPPFPGDLVGDYGVTRLSVSVIVSNTEIGGSDYKKDGFTYIIPRSNPQILDIAPGSGNAAGGEIVEIIGSDFRFYEPFEDEDRTGTWSEGEEFSDLNNSGRWDDFRDFSLNQLDNYLIHQFYIDHLDEDDIDEDKYTKDYTTNEWKDLDEVKYQDIVKETEKNLVNKFEDYLIYYNYMKEVESEDREYRDYTITEWLDILEDKDGAQGDEITQKELLNEAKENIDKDIEDELPDEVTEDITTKKFDELVKPVLPQVFFGRESAEIIDFEGGYLQVETPDHPAEEVRVQVLNNDGGITDPDFFIFEESDPTIEDLLPSVGHIDGRDRITLFGENFYPTEMDIYNEDLEVETKEMPMVRFGDITNRDIPIGEDNSGRIEGRRTTVELKGGLRVEYNAESEELTLSIEDDNTYEKTFPYSGGDKYIPVDLLQNSNNYDGFELIRVEVQDRRLFVERGYAPETEIVGDGEVDIYIPSYHTAEEALLQYINPDGGMDSIEFEYLRPDSNPVIDNITSQGEDPEISERDDEVIEVVKVDESGGHIISVEGEDLREGATVEISNIAKIQPEDIDYDAPDSLTFEMPEVMDEEGLHELRVINEDGGHASSVDAAPSIYIEVLSPDSNPGIFEVEPDLGPVFGGTHITIYGEEFLEGLRVFFDEEKVSVDNVDYIDDQTIEVTTPPGDTGETIISIENPDGAFSDPRGVFTYISAPDIMSIVDPDNTNDRINTISMEGDEEIKLQGDNFEEGTQVFFDPALTEEENGEELYIKEETYYLEDGNEAANVEYIDSKRLVVTTPEGKRDTSGVIVVNPDGGASAIYEDLTFGLPEIKTPKGVEAFLVDNRFIRISWDEVSDATEYIIYAKEDGGPREFIGSTELESFYFSAIEPRKNYSFEVKAVGEYGESKPSMETDEVSTGSRLDKVDEGRVVDKTTKDRSGNTAKVHVGLRERDDLTIDLTRGNLAGSEEVELSLPAKLLSRVDPVEIDIIGQDFYMSLDPSVFRSHRLHRNRMREDVGIKFEITETDSNDSDILNGYDLKAKEFLGSETNSIDYLSNDMDLSLEVDQQKANFRGLDDYKLKKYDKQNDEWKTLDSDRYTSDIEIRIDRLGTYSVIGSRGGGF